jgi:hypothetical protein
MEPFGSIFIQIIPALKQAFFAVSSFSRFGVAFLSFSAPVFAPSGPDKRNKPSVAELDTDYHN